MLCQNHFLSLKKMHKLEFCLVAMSDLIKKKDLTDSDYLINLASVSHHYLPPENENLDVPDFIFNDLKSKFNPKISR